MNSTRMEDVHPHRFYSEAMRIWIWVVIFAIAFAWVESAVVVYLRKIYYNGSFYFPLLIIKSDSGFFFADRLMRIEFGREIATIIMLLAISCAAGKKNIRKFSYFMISFGTWDIFYYIWLKIMTDWPESLMTWDLLFFIPLPWVAPVITPVLIAFSIVLAGSLLICLDEKGYDIQVRWFDWLVELGCALLMITAFCWDWKNIMRIPGKINYSGIPIRFAWWLYIPAYLFAVIYFGIRLKKIVKKKL